MPEQQAELRMLFCAALECKTPAERAEYIDNACLGRPELRSRVEALLQAQMEAGGFLEARDSKATARCVEPILEGPGSVLGPYKLLERIGEGGFGFVFMAEQRQPVRRKVAVKVLKPGMDTREVIARFEAERQALALMDHPNIARVLDAGETSFGRPYFVMELCRGVPITEYCDQNTLTPRERLKLFVSVCQAVQHAHLKGLIHRDIKPSNVLVGLHDGVASVKMIDFGIAKALGQQLTEKTLFTGFAQLLGTPLYMSPEQAGMSDLDIDTRSDIYSLGVLLYELLTGLTPFDKDRLREAGQDMRRMIREEETPKPSTRFSTVGNIGETISARRKSDPKRLAQLFRGELDWIVMKALDKDRSRRYQTASAFAADVEAYLADEPVVACPPSIAYRVRKFARRHKGAIRIAGMTTVMLLVAAGGLGWSIRDREARRSTAETLIDDALQHAAALVKQRNWPEASTEAKRAQGLVAGSGGSHERAEIVERLTADLEMVARLEEIRLQRAAVGKEGFDFSQADPAYADAFRAYGFDIEKLDTVQAATALRARNVPVELAVGLDDWALHCTPARRGDDRRRNHLLAIARLTDPDPWRNQLRDALETADQSALVRLSASASIPSLPPVTLAHLADSLREAGASAEADASLSRAQEQYPADFWINHELGMGLKAKEPPEWNEAIRFLTVAAALRPQSPGVLINLSNALQSTGRFEESIALSRRAIRLEPSFPFAHNSLGVALESKGRKEEAAAALREAIRLRPDFARAHTNLGNVLRLQNHLAAALAAHEEAIRLQPELAESHYNQGVTLQSDGQLDRAIAAYREAIRLKPDYVIAYNNLGAALRGKKQLDAAIAAFRDAIRIQPNYVNGHLGLGIALRDRKQFDAAIAEFREVIRLEPESARGYTNLGDALTSKRQPEQAIAAYREAIRIQPNFAAAHLNLGNALWENKQTDAAIAAYREAIRAQPNLTKAHDNLGTLLRATGQLNEAIAAFQQAIHFEPENPRAYYHLGNALDEKADPAAAIAAFERALELQPDYAEALCNLGQILVKQGEFARALKSLQRGHELGSKDPTWRYKSSQWIKDCERLLALDRQWSEILLGGVKPASPAECLEFARLCRFKHQHRAAAQFYEDAFAAQPELAESVKLGHRHDAASSATQAGCGLGEDGASLDAKVQAGLRSKALAWLRADLSAWARQVEAGNSQVQTDWLRARQKWRNDPTLAPVRDAALLAKLSPAEEAAWHKFWAEVDGDMKPAQRTPKP